MAVGTLERGWEAGSQGRERKEGKALCDCEVDLDLPSWTSSVEQHQGRREGGRREMSEWRAVWETVGEGGTGERWGELHGTLLFLLG